MKKKNLAVFGAGLFLSLCLFVTGCGRSTDSSTSQPLSSSEASSQIASESSSQQGEASSGETSLPIESSETSQTGESSESIHQHKAGTEWVTNADGHWHVCEECGEKLDYAVHTLENRQEVVEATCTTPGYTRVFTICKACGYIASDTKKDITDAKQHEFTVVKEKVDAGCTTPGYIIYKCSSCDETYRETLDPTGHDWQKGEKCDDLITCKNCDATKPGPGHNYHLESTGDADCTTDGKKVYKCDACGDTYDVVLKATGHQIEGEYVYDHREKVENKDCTYKLVYKAHCTKCDEDVYKTEDNEVVMHELITKYETMPTCSAKGSKGEYCTVCKQYIGDKEQVDADPNAHNWVKGETTDGVTTYTCSYCNDTKTVIISDKATATVSPENLNNHELELTNAAMKFDNIDDSQGNVELKVDELDPTDIISDPATLEKLNGKTVYDFTAKDGNGDNVSFDKATIRIPYELQADEDPDALIVYYIDDNGELQEVEAHYVDGYAIFETEHFSHYCITFMSPWEKCQKFGHHYGEVIEIVGTCLNDGFKHQYCSRCGDHKVFDYVKAPGHNYEENKDGSAVATCTKPGKTNYVCKNCGDTYGNVVPALGHDYVLDEKSTQDASCTKGGLFVYVCSRCGEDEPGHTYSLETAALGHKYETVIEPATCTKEGSVKYICSVCGEEDVTRRAVLEKVDHNYVLESEEPTKYIYVCDMCGDKKEVAKASGCLLNFDYAQEHEFFTNAGKTLVDAQLSAQGSVTYTNIQQYNSTYFDAKDAEIFVGFDENGMFSAYGKADVEVGNSGRATYAFYLKGDKIYTYNGNSYYVINLENSYLFGDKSVSVKDVINNIPNIVDFLKNDVTPYLNSILAIKGDDINGTLFNIIGSLFDYATTPTGFSVTFSSEKFDNLLKVFKEGTIKETIEFIIGKDNVDKILDRVSDYSKVSYKRALTMLKEDTGIDYKELLALVDKGVAKFTSYKSLQELLLDKAKVDINEYLTDRYLENHSFNQLVKENSNLARFFNNETLSDFIEKYVKSYANKKFVDIFREQGAPDYYIENIENTIDYVKQVADKVNFSLDFDYEGTLLGVNISTDVKVETGKETSFSLKGGLNIKLRETLAKTYDYAALKNFSDKFINAIFHDGGMDEALKTSFPSNAEITIENGIITRVVISNNYGGNSDYTTIGSKKDLLNYINYSEYPLLVEAVNQYGFEDYLIIRRYTYGNSRYLLDELGFNTLNISKGCGNSYSISLTLASDYEYTNSHYIYQIVEKGNMQNVVKTIEIANPYSYNSSYYLNATMNTTSGEINAQNSYHNWMVSTSMSHEAETCGEYNVTVYVCTNCGAQREERYQRSHTYDYDKPVSYKLLEEGEKASCYDGVEFTFECETCGALITRVYYDHRPVVEKALSLKDDFGFDVTARIRTCACGQSERYSDILVDGYHLVDTYIYINGQYYYCLYESDEFVDGEPSYIGFYTNSETHECKGTTYFVFVLNPYKDRSEQKISRQAYDSYDSHVSDTFYSDIVPTSPDDLSEGFDVTRTCYTCGKEIVTHYGPNDFLTGLVRFEKGHEPKFGDYYLWVHGYASELYQGIARSIDMRFYNCDFDTEKLDENTFLYTCARVEKGEDGTSVECGFRYFIKQNVKEFLPDSCKYYYYIVYGFGCDENGENPTMIFKLDNGYSGYEHVLGEDKVVNEYSFEDQNVRVVVEEGNCKYCGNYVSNRELVIDDKDITTEITSEVLEDGRTIIYPVGYSPLTGTINKPTNYTTEPYYNQEEAIIIKGEGSYEFIYRYYDLTYYSNALTYVECKQVANANGELLSSSIARKVYYFSDGGKLSYSYCDRNIIASRRIDEAEFVKLFKEYTLFDYDVEEFGCVELNIREYERDGVVNNKEIRITFRHDSEYHQGTCSTPSYYICKICGEILSVERSVRGHRFEYDSATQLYTCVECGITADSGYNGSLILEDVTDEEDKDTVKVSYFYNYHSFDTSKPWYLDNLHLEPQFVLVDVNNDDTQVFKASYKEAGNGITEHFITFSVDEVRRALEAYLEEHPNGYISSIGLALVETGYSHVDYYIYFTLEELGIELDQKLQEDFYVVGYYNGWEKPYPSDGRLLIQNPQKPDEYMLEDTMYLREGDYLQIASKSGKYFPDRNYRYDIEYCGEYAVYFCPEGNAEWDNGYFYVETIWSEKPVDEELLVQVIIAREGDWEAQDVLNAKINPNNTKEYMILGLELIKGDLFYINFNDDNYLHYGELSTYGSYKNFDTDGSSYGNIEVLVSGKYDCYINHDSVYLDCVEEYEEEEPETPVIQVVSSVYVLDENGKLIKECEAEKNPANTKEYMVLGIKLADDQRLKVVYENKTLKPSLLDKYGAYTHFEETKDGYLRVREEGTFDIYFTTNKIYIGEAQ